MHKGNGYVWLQYTRAKGGQGYIPIRGYYGGSNYGPKWGIITISKRVVDFGLLPLFFVIYC